MFRYFARFYDRYDMPIYPIALCSYASPRRAAKERHHLAFPALQVLDFHYRVARPSLNDYPEKQSRCRRRVAMTTRSRHLETYETDSLTASVSQKPGGINQTDSLSQVF
jgi:hypothetical protein